MARWLNHARLPPAKRQSADKRNHPLKNASYRRVSCGLLRAVPFQIPTNLYGASRASKRYRGSAHRVKRIRMRGNFAKEMWFVVAWVFFLLLIVLPWMVVTRSDQTSSPTTQAPAATRRNPVAT